MTSFKAICRKYSEEKDFVVIEILFFFSFSCIYINKKGRGFRKFNSYLFTDIDYVQLIEQKITAIKKQYAAWVYDIKNIACISNADIYLYQN